MTFKEEKRYSLLLMSEATMMKINSRFVKETCNYGICVKATLIWSHCFSLMWKEIDDTINRVVIQPFFLDVKGGEIEVVLPSMPKGEIIGNMTHVDCVYCHWWQSYVAW